MDEFSELKDRVRSIPVVKAGQSRYGLFLDSLVRVIDLRGRDARWDLWYISDNTDFCRAASSRKLRELQAAIQYLLQPIKSRSSRSQRHLSFDTLRQVFAEFLFFSFAALESFAHEVNLFYELGMPRQKVSFETVRGRLLGPFSGATITAHLDSLCNRSYYGSLRHYRNAVTHGYVFPISGSETGLLVPTNPKTEPFRFGGSAATDIRDLSNELSYLVDVGISSGWRCFEQDQLAI